jgi:hypothetical protein
VSTVDVRVDRGKLVVKRITHIALSSQMIALVRSDLIHYIEYTGKAIDIGSVQMNPTSQRLQPMQTMIRILKCHSPDSPVDIVIFGQQKLC